MKFTWRSILTGAVFLLFPLAHLSLVRHFPVYWAELPLLLIVAGLGVMVFKNQILERVGWSPLWLTPSLFVGGAVVAALLRQLPLHSLGMMKSFVFFPIIFFWWIALVEWEGEECDAILLLWWLGSVASALGAILGFTLGFTTYDHRLASLFSSPNHLAMLLAPGVLVGMYFLVHPRFRFIQQWFGLGLIGLLWAVALTRSYTVIGALVVGTVFFWCATRISGWRYVLLLTLFFAGSLVLWESSTDKFQSLFSNDPRSSLQSRFIIWQVAVRVAQDSFPWGIGIGQFQSTYLSYQEFFPPYLEWAVPEPHNLLLSFFFATGLPGVLGVGWLIGLLFWRFVKIFSYPQKTPNHNFGAVTGSLLSLTLIVGLVDTPYFTSSLALTFWGLLGFAWFWTRRSLVFHPVNT